MLYTFPIKLEKQFGFSSFQIALYFIPYGASAFIGSKIGGALCDYYAKTYGKGGRLIPSFVGLIVTSVTTFLYAFASELWVLMATAGLAGFFFSFARPALYSFAIQIAPRYASSVSHYVPT